MARKKAVGSSKNGRDSSGRRLGFKIFPGSFAIAGNIILRQRGTKFFPSDGVKMGKDHTIFAIKNGKITMKNINGRKCLSIE